MKRRELRCAHHSVSGRNATAKRSPALCSRETTPPRLQRWSELGKELGLLDRGKGWGAITWTSAIWREKKNPEAHGRRTRLG